MNTNNTPLADLPPIKEILPHRDTMLLLDRILDFTNESASAEYSPRSNEWYADAQGNMPAWIGIELMAQTIAAHVGLLKRSEGAPPKQGALLGTRSYRSTVPAFGAGEALRIDVTVSYRDSSGLGAYDCSITRGNDVLASATLKVYEPDDFEEFLQGSMS
jgi:predicted hotdog family 3-hydroxylacyl-ACP dehydratase